MIEALLIIIIVILFIIDKNLETLQENITKEIEVAVEVISNKSKIKKV